MPSPSAGSVPVERWVSVQEVCSHLGVVRDTVYRWIERRSMPAHRVGRNWKFKLSEVDAWVRAGGTDEVGQQGSPPPPANEL